MEKNLITKMILDGAFAVHKALGPGLLEKTYEECLVYELKKRNLSVERQKPLTIGIRKYKARNRL